MTVTYQSDERLTPDQVQAISFPSARLGRRGFDEEHVRYFCALVERELVTLLNEKASLWEEVNRLRRRVIGGEGAVVGVRPEDAHVQAVRILSNAQLTADQYVADAQQYSRELAEEARRRHDEVLAEARAHAEQVLEEAHQRASHAAAQEVSGIDGNGHRDARAELAYLRTFSDVYRTHLRAYLEALLQNVAEWERAERDSLGAARAGLPPPDVPRL